MFSNCEGRVVHLVEYTLEKGGEEMRGSSWRQSGDRQSAGSLEMIRSPQKVAEFASAEFLGGGLDAGVIAETVEPVDIWFAAEPRELAFGVLTRGLLNRGACCVKRELTAQMAAQFAIADKVERFRGFR